MPYRKFALSVGEHYHIYNRGNNFGDVYFHREDYVLFLRLLRKYLVASGAVELAAYCLMPNHFHLLALLLTDRISASMQPMMLAYTKTINHKYGRVGALIQGRFKAVHVSQDNHRAVLMEYIHRNPVEAGLAVSAQAWEFSSYRDYLGLRRGTLVPQRRLDDGVREMTPIGTESFGATEMAMIEAVAIDADPNPSSEVKRVWGSGSGHPARSA